jgi:hypothetical protein
VYLHRNDCGCLVRFIRVDVKYILLYDLIDCACPGEEVEVTGVRMGWGGGGVGGGVGWGGLWWGGVWCGGVGTALGAAAGVRDTCFWSTCCMSVSGDADEGQNLWGPVLPRGRAKAGTWRARLTEPAAAW